MSLLKNVVIKQLVVVKSKFVIKSLLVDEANIAIASKDGSDILVSKVDINNCKYGFTVFRKKTEFDFPIGFISPQI